MKKFNNSTIFELAKQSLMVRDLREYLNSINVDIEYPEPSTELLQKLNETEFKSEKIVLPYQLILSLQNLKPTKELIEIENFDLYQMIKWFKLKDKREKRIREYNILALSEGVLSDKISPPFLLLTQGKITVIDGRTRLLIAYAAKKNIHCEILKNINF